MLTRVKIIKKKCGTTAGGLLCPSLDGRRVNKSIIKIGRDANEGHNKATLRRQLFITAADDAPHCPSPRLMKPLMQMSNGPFPRFFSLLLHSPPSGCHNITVQTLET